MKFRIALTGQNGQVARSLKARELSDDVQVVTLARPLFDLTQPDFFLDILRAARPDVIVSAAAYTAVDQAESEAELAYAVNARAPEMLGRVAAALGIPIIHLSTDYVFSGDKPIPYIESDVVDPLNVYGHSKLAGERRLAATTGNYVVLRTSWVFSEYGHNFLATMLRLAVEHNTIRIVSDQLGRPTYADEIARIIIAVAKRIASDSSPGLRGVFHMAGSQDASWSSFAEGIFEQAGKRGLPSPAIKPILTADWPTAARRPKNSRLDCSKLYSSFGMELDPWPISLDKCLHVMVKSGLGI